MKRGFKARAEKLSEELRGELGLRIDEALPARKLAEHLGVRVMGVEDIPGIRKPYADWLLNGAGSGWSGFTLTVGCKTFIVHNTSHAPTRQESDLMHELAHVLCKHPPGGILHQIGDFPLRHYNREEEDEAVWLGAALQIPGKSLIRLARNSWSIPRIARRFGASERLTRFRYNTCGIDARLRREGRNSRKSSAPSKS
ncbi:MAG: ImmA/IrrE family metallo-endopeptidase [Bacteroidetes bacterium]|nr:ImmA/IrrE family metallo-endopeptidase [Bacteroidota bacterium]